MELQRLQSCELAETLQQRRQRILVKPQRLQSRELAETLPQRRQRILDERTKSDTRWTLPKYDRCIFS